MQTLFTILITLQFLIIAIHDLIDIPHLHYGSQVKVAIGRNKVILATLINATLPGLAAFFALYFFNQPAPRYATNYWLIYCTLTFASAIAMWYLPYFFGCSEKTKTLYTQMYARTLQILPPRGNNPRPNVLHLAFHLLFAATLTLSLLLRFST